MLKNKLLISGAFMALIYAVLVGIVPFLLCSCQDTLEPKPVDKTQEIVFEKANIDGVVIDEQGMTVKDAYAYIVGTNITTVTDSNGVFRLREVNAPNKRCVVRCYKRGYFTVSRGIITEFSKKQAIQIVLANDKNLGTIQGSTGGKVILNQHPTNPAYISIQSGSIVDSQGEVYTGTVNVIGRYMNPAEQNFGKIISGSDLYGRDKNGNEVLLYSMGMIDINLETPDAEPLQLRDGKPATISFPIPPGRAGKAKDAISLLYFDEVNGLWRESGVANKNKENNSYVGSVTHFSTWNIDYLGEKALLSGKVVDCNNEPVLGAVVNLDGAVTYTDSLGKFAHWVPANMELKITAHFEGMPINTDGKLITLSPNSNFDCGQLKLSCPSYLNCVVLDCETTENNKEVLVIASFNDPKQVRRYMIFNTSLMQKFRIPVMPAFGSATLIVATYDKRKIEVITVNKPNTQKAINLCKEEMSEPSKITIERRGYDKTILLPDTQNPAIPRLSGILFRDSSNNSDPETYKISVRTFGGSGHELSFDFYKKINLKRNDFLRFFMNGFDNGNSLAVFKETFIPIQDSTEINIEKFDNRLGGDLKFNFRLVYKDEAKQGSFVTVTGNINCIFEKVD